MISEAQALTIAAFATARQWVCGSAPEHSFQDAFGWPRPVFQLPADNDPAITLRKAARDLSAAFFNERLGRMDYTAAGRSVEFARLAEAATALDEFDPRTLDSVEDKLAFWINVYNALAIHAVVAFAPQKTIWEIPRFFSRAAYRVGGLRCSLAVIEHGILRANQPAPFSLIRPIPRHDPLREYVLSKWELEPKIHFALNCASRSCPPIAVYSPDFIDAQLEVAAVSFLRAESRLEGSSLVTSSLLHWYRRDFGNDLIEFLLPYLPDLQRIPRETIRIVFRPYDWSLNH